MFGADQPWGRGVRLLQGPLKGPARPEGFNQTECRVKHCLTEVAKADNTHCVSLYK